MVRVISNLQTPSRACSPTQQEKGIKKSHNKKKYEKEKKNLSAFLHKLNQFKYRNANRAGWGEGTFPHPCPALLLLRVPIGKKSS